LLHLRNNKAPGTDGIPAELLKNGGPYLTQKLYNIIHRIWEEKQMPEEWNNMPNSEERRSITTWKLQRHKSSKRGL
jgi:hypothetical protein